jgi:hypothetical protein
VTDTGTGYGRPRPTFMRELTLVGPGSPMGELLRRYWHPVGLVGDAALTPKALRVLGEDLVLFRDRRGRPGLKAQLDALAEGRDPIGVSFDPAAPAVSFEASNFLIERQPHAS